MVLSCVMTRKTKLLSALRRELRISDGLVRRLKPLDAFRVNGESAHTNRVLEPGDRVSVIIEEAAPDFPAQDGPLSILYEDACLIALDKPAGVLVHPSFSRQTGTLANDLLGYYRRTGQACAVHVLTRLDRDTMGVVIFAKNAWAHWQLMEQLADGRLEKVYEALTLGGPEAEGGSSTCPSPSCPTPASCAGSARRASPPGPGIGCWSGARSAAWSCGPSRAAPTSCGYTARIWAFRFWGTPSMGRDQGSGIREQGTGAVQRSGFRVQRRP